jgi:hypothetical protein
VLGSSGMPNEVWDDEAKPRLIDGALALTVLETAQGILRAKTPEHAVQAEVGLLEALHEHASQRPGTKRRASILKVVEGSGHMVRRVGIPTGDFARAPASFAKGTGLCWTAVRECGQTLAANPAELGGWVQEYDVPHGQFVPVAEEAPFKSILIAPVWSADEVQVPLGAVCLDSNRNNFYSLRDKIIVVMIAKALALGWTSSTPPALAVTQPMLPGPLPPGP